MQRSGSKRSIRMGDLIMRELANMLERDVQDPRLELVTISGVRLNSDLRVAEVLFTVHGGQERAAEALKGFEKAKGFLRSGLGKRCKLKFLPELRFTYDTFLEDMVYAKPADED